ncbi:hypothetical protein QF041_004679 [Paenibacillus sp. W2I17]|nr:hypothetical protein [Paenibacillus sp. W2I17]
MERNEVTLYISGDSICFRRSFLTESFKANTIKFCNIKKDDFDQEVVFFGE